MKNILLSFLIFSGYSVCAQELFTWSEPASNMAAKGIGIRLNNTLMKENNSGKYNYHLLPEVMLGLSANLMIHVEGFLSNADDKFTAEGAAIYAKYRIFSEDEVHNHFRIALYTRAAINNSDLHQPAIELSGHNSGYEAGMVLTKLVNKIAYSAGGSLVHATNNSRDKKYFVNDGLRNAFAWNVSFGKLMLPKEYTSYGQTNVNLMMEVLGQTNFGNGRSYVDIAPTIQFIILSKMRLDAGYRFAMVKDLGRSATNGFLLRLEYNIFNAFK